MVVFWSYQEITRSQAIIDKFTSAPESIRRGELDAQKDYDSGWRAFHHRFDEKHGDFVPGISFEQLEKEFKEILDHSKFYNWCGTGPRYDQKNPSYYALHLEGYHENPVYLHAYNQKMAKLIRAEKNI